MPTVVKWYVLFMPWRSWARLENLWAQVVCVLIMPCVAERAHVQMCRETRLHSPMQSDLTICLTA